MKREVEVFGRQIREPVSSHLIRNVEKLLDVFDRNVLLLFRFSQVLHCGSLRSQHRCCEIVGLDPLTHIIQEIVGVSMTKNEVTQRLQHHGTCTACRQVVSLRDIDNPVPLISN